MGQPSLSDGSHQIEKAVRVQDGEQSTEKVNVQIPNETSPLNSQVSPEDVITYPEGGLSSWLVVFGAWCAMTGGLGLLNTIAPLQYYIAQNILTNDSESSIAWIFSLYVFIVFFCSLQIGPLFDAIGPRILIAVGSCCLLVAMLVLGECTRFWHFILGFSILAGIGSSLLFTPPIAAVGHHFYRRRGFATGIAITGPSTGGIIFPLVFQAAYPKLGFAWATRVLAFIMLGLLVLANIFLRSRLPRRRPTLRSVLPDFKIFLDGTGAFALCTAGLFTIELALFVPIGYLTSYCAANGIDTALSYQILAILNAGSIIGRCIPGYIADKVGRYNTMVACLILCALVNLGLWLPISVLSLSTSSTEAAVVTYSILFGLVSGSNLSLIAPCVGQLCETSEYGRYFATSYTIVSFATLIGLPIAGTLIVAANGSYWGLVVFVGLVYSVSTGCMLAVRIIKVGWGIKTTF